MLYCNVIHIHFQHLMDWINDVLAERRVVVKSLEEDLNDGQVLAMLVRKYSSFVFCWKTMY